MLCHQVATNSKCNRPRIGTALSRQSHSLPITLTNNNHSRNIDEVTSKHPENTGNSRFLVHNWTSDAINSYNHNQSP